MWVFFCYMLYWCVLLCRGDRRCVFNVIIVSVSIFLLFVVWWGTSRREELGLRFVKFAANDLEQPLAVAACKVSEKGSG